MPKSQLTRYLADREQATGDRFIGIATDGAKFQVYNLHDSKVREIHHFSPSPETPRDFIADLESAVCTERELDPDPAWMRRELGRQSPAYIQAQEELNRLWREAKKQPEARLKLKLWARLLRFVYGEEVPNDLFIQHTYLAIVAKAIAYGVLKNQPPRDADLFLRGESLRELGIAGSVESDFSIGHYWWTAAR